MPDFNFGIKRVEVLFGFFNGVFLIFISFRIMCESIDRIFEPQKINQSGLLTVSTLGFCVNVIGLLCFHDLHNHECSHDHSGHEHKQIDSAKEKHHDHKKENKCKDHDHKDHDHKSHKHEHKHDHKHDHKHEHKHDHKHKDKNEHKHEKHEHSSTYSHSHSHDLEDPKHEHHEHKHEDHSHEHPNHDSHHNENIYGVFLHILADAMGSLGVIISSLLIKYFGWTIADPICSTIISILIFVSVIPLI